MERENNKVVDATYNDIVIMSLNAEHWSGHELLSELEPLQAHAHIFINEGDHLGSAGLIPSLNIICQLLYFLGFTYQIIHTFDVIQ